MLCSQYTRSFLGATLVALLLVAGCQTQSSQNQQSTPPPLPDNELSIEEPWVRPASAGSTTALYMTIANGLQSTDTLLEARAPIIDSSEVYGATATGTEVIEGLPIPARSRVTLKPESTHVQLVNLGQSLDENSSVILNLEFAQSGLQRVRVPVQPSAPAQ